MRQKVEWVGRWVRERRKDVQLDKRFSNPVTLADDIYQNIEQLWEKLWERNSSPGFIAC